MICNVQLQCCLFVKTNWTAPCLLPSRVPLPRKPGTAQVSADPPFSYERCIQYCSHHLVGRFHHTCVSIVSDCISGRMNEDGSELGHSGLTDFAESGGAHGRGFHWMSWLICTCSRFQILEHEWPILSPAVASQSGFFTDTVHTGT